MSSSQTQQIVRLHRRIEELEKQNAELASMLTDAINICDAALGDAPAEKPHRADRARPQVQGRGRR
jgi:hypothetical protein